MKRSAADYIEHLPVLDRAALDSKPAVQIAEFPPTKIDANFRPSTTEELLAALGSWEWRMFSGALYRIIIKGEEGAADTSLPFIPNRAQRRLLANLHNRNIVLKAASWASQPLWRSSS